MFSDDNAAPFSGAVYIYERRNSGEWVRFAYLKADNRDESDRFGASISLDGDTLVVGAWSEDGNGLDPNDDSATNSGAAYVFRRDPGDATDWEPQQYLKGSNTAESDEFGYSVAVSGNTLVVGAPEHDGAGAASGGAYVFTRSNEGSWTEQQYLLASNAENADRFGWSVAIDGDRLVIGAINESSNGVGGESDNSAVLAGAAYVFSRDDTHTWTKSLYLKASNAGIVDRFGWSVAIAGDAVAVAAPEEASNGVDGETDNSASKAGAAYVFD